MALISVSIVTYHPDIDFLARLFEALGCAAAELSARGYADSVQVTLADNSDDEAAFADISRLLKVSVPHLDLDLERMPSNLGYGRAHNHCIENADSAYHLVLNPDVLVRPDALVEAVAYLEQHPEVGLLTPRVFDENGAQSYLAKRVPAWLICCCAASHPDSRATGSQRGWTATRCVT